MTAAIDWTLDPADIPVVATLRYAPVLFLAGYAGPALLTAVLAVPALLSNPGLLALCGLLVLVGGPFSVLYLWPMLRDPAQRPDPEQFGWLAGLDPGRVVLVILAGAVASLPAAATVGSTVVRVLAFGCLVAALPLLGLFDGAGEVDPGSGTLTFRERTLEVNTLAGVRWYRFDGVVVCLLSYVEGAGGFGRPYVVAVPEPVAAAVLGVLEDGVAATPDVRRREPDPTAGAVLIGVALLSFATGASAVFLLREAALLVGLVTGGLGLLFAAGAYTVA